MHTQFLLLYANIFDHIFSIRFITGLVYKKQNLYEEALECFWKVRNIVRYDPQTTYQIGHLCQLVNEVDQATEW